MTSLYEDIEKFHEYGLWLPSRTIKLDLLSEDASDVEINHAGAARFFKNLLILEELGNEPIRVYINCPGGLELDGIAVYDAIKSSKCHMTGIVLGQAQSMGAIILQAFDHRIALPSSYFMLHDGSDTLSGNVRDIEKTVEANKALRLEGYKALSQRTGKEAAYWNRKLATDYILSAPQALTENLIDEILDKRD